MGYIYIAQDATKPNKAKVGMTSKSPHKRISQTENPDYELFAFYEVADQKLKQTETTIHEILANEFQRIIHRSSNRQSEWFLCSPQQAKLRVLQHLALEIDKQVITKHKELAQLIAKQSKLHAEIAQFDCDKDSALESMTDEELNYLIKKNITINFSLDELLDEQSERNACNYHF
ncbi:GIY-YIG nuclease family protein [Vibrio cortegadensis]|uniref:GIY-YIG nuclease family protein n=1 Tax=Vibrio cortegadensis TaxID=1328770 RepID=UPI00352FBA95